MTYNLNYTVQVPETCICNFVTLSELIFLTETHLFTFATEGQQEFKQGLEFSIILQLQFSIPKYPPFSVSTTANTSPSSLSAKLRFDERSKHRKPVIVLR